MLRERRIRHALKNLEGFSFGIVFGNHFVDVNRHAGLPTGSSLPSTLPKASWQLLTYRHQFGTLDPQAVNRPRRGMQLVKIAVQKAPEFRVGRLRQPAVGED